MKKKLFAIMTAVALGLTMTAATAQAEVKKVLIKGLMKPQFMAVDEDQIYISQSSMEILIYSLKDFTFKKKFGQKGEGPGEFQLINIVTPQKGRLMVNSFGKLSWYTRDGGLIDSIKPPSGGGFLFTPLGDGYVGQNQTGNDDGFFTMINHYDQKLAKTHEIYRVRAAEAGFKKFNFFGNIVPFAVLEDKLFIARGQGFVVDCVDKMGKVFFKIEQKDYKPRPFTSQDEKTMRDFFAKQNPQGYETLKGNLWFPSNYPEVFGTFADPTAQKLYVFTWKFSDGKYEVFKYSKDGKLEKSLQLPVQMQDTIRPNPVTLENNKMYHLMDNEELEEWELVIIDVK